jgi:Domain of unknown function (DUF1707)
MDTTVKDDRNGDLRVSDADRDRALEQLSEHFQAGRLSAEELDERSGRALRARTRRELADLFTDLPRDLTHAQEPVVSPGDGRVGLPFRGPAVLTAVAAFALVAFAIEVLAGGHHGLYLGFGGPGGAGILIIVLVVARLARHHHGRE